MADKYTIYKSGDGTYCVVEIANIRKSVARGLTSAEARDKARELNSK